METYLTIEGIADYLKLTIQTIRRWIRNRKIPFHKINGVIRFRLSEIERWIDGGGLVLTEEREENDEGNLFSGAVSPDELTGIGSGE